MKDAKICEMKRSLQETQHQLLDVEKERDQLNEAVNRQNNEIATYIENLKVGPESYRLLLLDYKGLGKSMETRDL